MRTAVRRSQVRVPPSRLVFVNAYTRFQNGKEVLVKEHW